MARLSKGVGFTRKLRGKTHEEGIPDPLQGRRQEELQVVMEARDGYVLLWKRPLYPMSAEVQLP